MTSDPTPRPSLRETLDAMFPVVMKYGGLAGAIVATIAALTGHQVGVPLLGLFGSMMGVGQIADALKSK